MIRPRHAAHRLLLATLVLFLLTQSAPAIAQETLYGPDAVWNPDEEAHKALSDCELDPNCNLTSFMAAHGASAAALAFTQEHDGWAYLMKFDELGPVDLGHAWSPFAANNLLDYKMLNGNPASISAQEAGSADLSRIAVYDSLLARYPEMILWPGNPNYVGQEKTVGGGQRFTFSFRLVDGCNACEQVGTALVAYEFDAQGRFLGSTHLPPILPDQEPPPQLIGQAPENDTADKPATGQIAYIQPASDERPSQGNIWLVNDDGTNPQQITNSSVDCCLAWAPDGQVLYFVRHGDAATDGHVLDIIMSFDFATGKQQTVYETDFSIRGNLAVAPDGRTLAMITNSPLGDNFAWIDNIACVNSIDLATGSSRELLCEEQVFLGDLEFNPGGQSLLLTISPFEAAIVASLDLATATISTYEGFDVCCYSTEVASRDNRLYAIGNGYYMFSTFQENGWDGFGIFEYGQGLQEPNDILISADPLSGLDLSPEEDRLAFSRNGMIEVVDLGKRPPVVTSIVAGIQPVWRSDYVPAVVPITELLDRKQTIFEQLETTTYQSTAGVIFPDPITAYDETAARKLIATLRAADPSTITPEQAAALERLVMQEETLAVLLADYTRLANEQADVAVDLAGMWTGTALLSLKAGTRIEQAFADLAMKTVEDFIKLLLHFVEDETLREALRTGLDDAFLTLDAVEGDAGGLGEEFLERAIDGGVRAQVVAELVPVLVEAAQPAVDRAVRSVSGEGDSGWSTDGLAESAEINMTSLIDQSRIMSDLAHDIYTNHLGRGRDVNEFLKDIVDLALLGTRNPIGLIFSLQTRLQQILIDSAASSVLSAAMACPLDGSRRSGEFAFQPDQVGFACEVPAPTGWGDFFDRLFTDAGRRDGRAMGKLAPPATQPPASGFDAALAGYQAAITALESELADGSPEVIRQRADELLAAADTFDGLATPIMVRLGQSTSPDTAAGQLALGVALTQVRFDGLFALLATEAYLDDPSDADAATFGQILGEAQQHIATLSVVEAQVPLPPRPDSGLPVIVDLPAEMSGVLGETLSIPVTIMNAGGQPFAGGIVTASHQGAELVSQALPELASDDVVALTLAYPVLEVGTAHLRVRATVGDSSDYRTIRVTAAEVEETVASADDRVGTETGAANDKTPPRGTASTDRLRQLLLAVMIASGLLFVLVGGVLLRQRGKG